MVGLSLDRITNAALLANPATAPIAFTRSFNSAIGQAFIQRVGDMMGVKQSQIDMAQGRFAASQGDFRGAFHNVREAFQAAGREHNLSHTQEAEAERDMNKMLNKMASNLAEGDEGKRAKAGGGKGGGSWLMALAEALGKKLDKMASEMSSMADQITDKNPSMTTKFGAKSQEFGILMNAATNAIKSIGEAEANSARKG